MQVHAADEPADRLREPWGEQNADYVRVGERRASSRSRRYVRLRDDLSGLGDQLSTA
jgi:hypothetical protein